MGIGRRTESPAGVDAGPSADTGGRCGRGYKPINRNGILVFCRSEGQVGTHFERTRCNTLDELKNAELIGQEYTQHIQQQGSPTPFKP